MEKALLIRVHRRESVVQFLWLRPAALGDLRANVFLSEFAAVQQLRQLVA